MLRVAVHKYFPGIARFLHRYRVRRWKTVPHIIGSLKIYAPPVMEAAYKLERVVFTREAKSADVCIDIGANVGWYTCIAANICRCVVAIEPIHENLVTLYRNLILNDCKNVEVFPVGLSDHKGIAEISGYAEMSSLTPDWSSGSMSNRRYVPISTLDTLLGGRFEGKRLFIKIDVEGHEDNLLDGAICTLARDPKPVWLVEILSDNGRAKDIFERRGYICEPIDGRNFLMRGDK